MFQPDRLLSIVPIRMKLGNNFPVQHPEVAFTLDFLKQREIEAQNDIVNDHPDWRRHLRPKDPPLFGLDYALRCRTAIEEAWLTGSTGRVVFAFQRNNWPRFATEADHAFGTLTGLGPLGLITHSRGIEERMSRAVSQHEAHLGVKFSPESRQRLIVTGVNEGERAYEQLVLDPTGFELMDSWLARIKSSPRLGDFNPDVFFPALEFVNSLYRTAYGYLESREK